MKKKIVKINYVITIETIQKKKKKYENIDYLHSRLIVKTVILSEKSITVGNDHETRVCLIMKRRAVLNA